MDFRTVTVILKNWTTVVTTAEKQRHRSSLPRPRFSSVYRETRRSLAASCELNEAAVVSFTGSNFYRVFDTGKQPE
jgi:hypothetical protein